MPKSERHEYDPIGPSSLSLEEKDTQVPLSEHDSEDEPFLHTRKHVPLSNLCWIIPWILSASFAICSCVLFVDLLEAQRVINNISQLRAQNEFIDPAIIPHEQVRFTGSPQFDLNGYMSHKPYDKSMPWPENVTYFGEPSPEIDANWEKLIGWRYFSISEDEAKAVWPDTYLEYVDQLRGGFTAGLDVFHTLHCLNAIRKALHPDYYNETFHNEVPHADHCLDAIRQYIQCAGITTLIPTQFHEAIKRNYIESNQMHTCRSFTYLREWVDNRKPDGPDFKERDQTVIDSAKHALALDRLAQVLGHMEAAP